MIPNNELLNVNIVTEMISRCTRFLKQVSLCGAGHLYNSLLLYLLCNTGLSFGTTLKGELSPSNKYELRQKVNYLLTTQYMYRHSKLILGLYQVLKVSIFY